jgi:hypothetical protein
MQRLQGPNSISRTTGQQEKLPHYVGEDVVCTPQIVKFDGLPRIDKIPASITKNFCCNYLPLYLKITT